MIEVPIAISFGLVEQSALHVGTVEGVVKTEIGPELIIVRIPRFFEDLFLCKVQRRYLLFSCSPTISWTSFAPTEDHKSLVIKPLEP